MPHCWKSHAVAHVIAGVSETMDRHTRVRYERNPGFLERIGGSLAGILVGIVLIVAGCVLLFWNEV